MMMSPFLIPPTKLWLNLFYFSSWGNCRQWAHDKSSFWITEQMWSLIQRSETRRDSLPSERERHTQWNHENCRFFFFLISRDLLEAMARAQHIKDIWELITSAESLETRWCSAVMHEDKVTKSFLKSSDPRTQQKVPFSKLKSCVQLFSVVRGLWEDYQKGAASGGGETGGV